MTNIFSYITQFISPPYCVSCEKSLQDYTVLCETCYTELPKIFSREVAVTGTRSLVVHAFTAYQKPCDKLIQAKLSAQRTPIYQLALLLADYTKTIALECDTIVPIPLHWQRKMWRGFNQADILAQEVAPVVHAPVMPALMRIKQTQFQSKLSPEDRKENIAGVFSLDQKYLTSIKNKKILLIDDLYTTGATATAAAKELYKHGASSVELLVACKVID